LLTAVNNYTCFYFCPKVRRLQGCEDSVELKLHV